MRIGAIAKQSGVSVDTVRFYERVGVLPGRGAKAVRVPRVRARDGRAHPAHARVASGGLSLNEIVEALAAHDAGGATCESERWRLDAVRERVDAKLAELAALGGRIVAAQDACAAGQCRFTEARDA